MQFWKGTTRHEKASLELQVIKNTDEPHDGKESEVSYTDWQQQVNVQFDKLTENVKNAKKDKVVVYAKTLKLTAWKVFGGRFHMARLRKKILKWLEEEYQKVLKKGKRASNVIPEIDGKNQIIFPSPPLMSLNDVSRSASMTLSRSKSKSRKKRKKKKRKKMRAVASGIPVLSRRRLASDPQALMRRLVAAEKQFC